MKRKTIFAGTETSELLRESSSALFEHGLERPKKSVVCDNNTKKRLIPLTKWPQFHEWPTAAGLRYYVFNAEYNGFTKVFKKVGKRILIDEQAFHEWVCERNENSKVR